MLKAGQLGLSKRPSIMLRKKQLNVVIFMIKVMRVTHQVAMMSITFAVPTWSLGPTGPPLRTAMYAFRAGVDSVFPLL